MPSPADTESGRDGADDGIEAALGRLGDLLWLTSVGVAVAVLAVVAFLAAAGVFGRLSPTLGVAVLLVGLLGTLYLLFGNGLVGGWRGPPARDVSRPARRAPGPLSHRPPNAPGGDRPSGAAAFAAGFAGIALAGWLAYLGGLDRLTSLAP